MRHAPRSVMLFAAGFGTRMQPLTHDRPKPLVLVAGKPLVDHALALTDAIKPDVIVANLHYKAEQLDRHLMPRGVTCIHETPDILDTGGGLKNAIPALGGGDVFTLNTDAVWTGPNPLEALRRAWQPDRMDALLMCIPVATASGYSGTGDFALSDGGRLMRGAGLVYGGAQIIKTDTLDRVQDRVFSLNRVWTDAQRTGRLFGLVHQGGWCDVGHPDGILAAETLLEQPHVRD